MKLLAADDQPIIRKFVGAKLRELGHEVLYASTGDEAIKLYDELEPDLILIDHHMPGKTGLEVVEHVRVIKKRQTPIIIMSSNDEEDVIVKAFKLGVDDYIEKPVGIKELVMRVQRLLFKVCGVPIQQEQDSSVSAIVQKKYVGVVIPCYNEESRLAGKEFSDFIHSNLGYHLCFVNDGSKDRTLEILKALESEHDEYISVFNLERNSGKAEAVRQGVLHLAKDPNFDYIGYLDADLSTDFVDFNELVNTIISSNYKIVSGSRISRVGADITKSSARSIISRAINLIIRTILGMGFQDTQCGAKVMTKEVADNMFNDKFITKWLFDVEIFIRMKKFYGADSVKSLIYEQPLKRWIHAEGSKLSMKDSLKILTQLSKITVYYRKYKPVNSQSSIA